MEAIGSVTENRRATQESRDTKGLIFDIQKFSLHDGPGFRTLVFMKGCPAECLWCSNPEGQEPHTEIMFIKGNCIGCGKCVVVCPVAGAISAEDFEINRELCTNCGECAEVCPANAKKLTGRWVSVGELVKEVEKDRLFYKNSGGGVTVGGGEPLMQHEFVANFLKECQRLNIHTAIETCGVAKWEHLEKVLKYTDLLYFDIKHMDRITHIKWTGVDNAMILENAKRASSVACSMIVRIPLISRFNDSKRDIEEAAEFVHSLNKDMALELLPYHTLGAPKYQWLGLEYKANNCRRPTMQHMQMLKETIERHEVKALIGGVLLGKASG